MIASPPGKKAGGTSAVTLVLATAAAVVVCIFIIAGYVSSTHATELREASMQSKIDKKVYSVVEEAAGHHTLPPRPTNKNGKPINGARNGQHKPKIDNRVADHHVADVHPDSPEDHPGVAHHRNALQHEPGMAHGKKVIEQLHQGKHQAEREMKSLMSNAMQQDAEYVAKARAGIKCPVVDEEAMNRELQIPLKHLPRGIKTSVLQKYNRRAHNCASHGIWNRVRIDDHHKIMEHMVRLGRIERNSYIFDWGAGCGHTMDWMHKEYNITGVGVDVSTLTIEYARANTTKSNIYCVADGTKLEWLPSNSFDHAISFGSIYHVYNRTLFCHVLRQLVRIVRPVTGTVYNGWTENAEFNRKHYEACLGDLPVHYDVLEEKKEFADVEVFPLKAQQHSPNTYSLRIEKRSAVPADEEAKKFSLESIPIACDEHVCVKRADEKSMALLAKRAAEQEKRKGKMKAKKPAHEAGEEKKKNDAEDK